MNNKFCKKIHYKHSKYFFSLFRLNVVHDNGKDLSQMEIRNNTAMNTQSFGMALRRPQDVRKFLEAANEFNLRDSFVVSGVKQMAKDLGHLKHYDVRYDEVMDSFEVIENASDSVVRTFSNNSPKLPKSPYKAALNALDEVKEKEKHPVKDYFAVAKSAVRLLKMGFLKPRDLLSRAFIAAANEAETLDKTVSAFEK